MIFVQISSLIKAIPKIIVPKATNWSAFPVVSPVEPWLGFSFLIFLLITSALLTGCGSSNHIQTVPIKTIRDHQVHDTIYINNVQYDSIYVSQDKFIDRSKDTILIHQHDVEYRYKFLRDTIYKTKIELQRDSIPYEVRITEVKQVKYTPPWVKTLAIIGSITIFVLLIYTITKLKHF